MSQGPDKSTDQGRTTVYTDGACLGNPGPGGWAWAVPGGRWRSGADGQTTNQRMEIAAALDAARTLDGPLEVVSDSTYVVNCFRDGWWKGWLARGWVGASKQKVANRDLWEPLVDLYSGEPGRLAFRWVKGHSADPFNDLVDRLAVAAAGAQHGGEGLAPPDDAALGPADAPAARPRPRSNRPPWPPRAH
jgi:ribonuclease HI